MPPDQGDRAGGAGSIEFLPPDERAFGPADELTFPGFDGDDGFGDDPADDAAPRSRWATALAGVGVVGILAVGVVAAAPWAADDTATAPPTTQPAPSERSGVPTTVGPAGTAAGSETEPRIDPDTTGWILDPVPDGWRSVQFLRADRGIDEDSGWGEVWATPGASRTSGRWFSLTLLPFRSLDPGSPTWFPVDVAGRDGLADVGADGVVTLAWDAGVPDADRLITVDAFGFTLTELVELADSIGIIDDRPQMVDDRPEFRRPELLDGLERLAAETTEGDLTSRVLIGGRVSTVAYYTGDRPWEVTLVQEQLDGVGSGDPLLALSLNRYLVAPDGWTVPEAFAGGDVVVGRRTIGSYDLTVVRWTTDDGRTLSVLSTDELDDTLAMMDAVRFAPAEEWAQLERREAEGVLGRRTPPGLTVQSGALADGRDFAALHWDSSDELELRVGTATVFQPLGDTPLRVLTVGDVSLLVAQTDASPATVEITDARGTLGVPLVAVTRTATDGTVRTSYLNVVPLPDLRDAGAFTAEIVGPTGETVSRLAPWG